MATSKDYAALTTRILAHYGHASPSVSHRTDISDILSHTFDMATDKLEYFGLILSIKASEVAMTRNTTINRDDLQMKTDVAEGTKFRMGLKAVTQDNEYAISMGAQGDDKDEALEEFLKAVETAGDLVLAGFGASGQDAEGEEGSDLD